jgi:hypothetical protein
MEVVVTVSIPALGPFLSAASRCAAEMLYNALYMQRELSRLVLDEADSQAIRDLCVSLVGTKHEIVTEVTELEALAGRAAPDLESVIARVGRIEAGLADEIRKMHPVVQRLEALATSNPRAGAPCLLVAESAVNIMNAFGLLDDAATTWREALKRGVES